VNSWADTEVAVVPLPTAVGGYSANIYLQNILPVIIGLERTQQVFDTFELYGDYGVLLGVLRGQDSNSKILVQNHPSVHVIRTGGLTPGNLIASPVPNFAAFQPELMSPWDQNGKVILVLCQCTPGFPCLPPGAQHRNGCPVMKERQREVAERYDALGRPGVMRQSWNETARPMVSVGAPDTIADLRAENERLRAEVLANRRDKLAQAAMRDEIAQLRAVNESLTKENERLRITRRPYEDPRYEDQRPGPRTPCAQCDGRRVVPQMNNMGKLVTGPCPACSSAGAASWNPANPAQSFDAILDMTLRTRQEPLPDTSVRVVEMDDNDVVPSTAVRVVEMDDD